MNGANRATTTVAPGSSLADACDPNLERFVIEAWCDGDQPSTDLPGFPGVPNRVNCDKTDLGGGKEAARQCVDGACTDDPSLAGPIGCSGADWVERVDALYDSDSFEIHAYPGGHGTCSVPGDCATNETCSGGQCVPANCAGDGCRFATVTLDGILGSGGTQDYSLRVAFEGSGVERQGVLTTQDNESTHQALVFQRGLTSGGLDNYVLLIFNAGTDDKLYLCWWAHRGPDTDPPTWPR